MSISRTSWYNVRGLQKLEYLVCHINERFLRNFVDLDGDLLPELELPPTNEPNEPLDVTLELELAIPPPFSYIGSRTDPALGLIPNENKKSKAIVKPVFSCRRVCGS